MAIADYLQKIGHGLEEGVETAGRVAGAVAEPLGKSVAETLSGEAPQIHAEKRQHAQQLSDEQRQNEINDLEKQLDEGRKYGTLTTEQQKQYTDAIARHYSDPSQMGTLIQKLHKATHPGGATYQPYTPQLADPTPQGGTAFQDESAREEALADSLGLRQAATDEEIDRRAQDAAKYHKAAGKSPPTPGNQIPQDAMGPDGQVIPSTLRTPGQSFMEWNGAWYPAPKAKPIYKPIGGNVYLMDPATGLPIRKLGPTEGVKVSTHQTPFLGDDGQMHLLSTTSVTTPQGETIEVEAPPPESGGPEAPQKTESTKADTPKTSAKKVTPGSLLPKTGVKPASAPSGGVAGPAIRGSHAWAQSKDPMFKANVGSYKKANDDVIAATKLSSLADQVAANPRDAVNQKRLAVALERQASGRYTTQALEFVITAGWGNTLEQWANNPSTGALSADVMRQLVDGAHQNLRAAQDALKISQSELGSQPSPQSGSGGGFDWNSHPVAQ
jgi:hypothetical protein